MLKSFWPTKKLTDLCKLERGTEPGSDSYVKDLVGTIPFLRVGDLTGKVDAKRFVKKSNNNLQVVNKNETLITFDGTPGIVVRRFSGAIASGIRVIRNLKPEINGDFLFYYLQTPVVQKTIRAYSKGATIIHASAAIPYIKILLPPLKTQRKIVERLDTIKKAQELNDKQIELAEELFQSLLHRELDPKGKNWEIKKIEDVAEVTSSKRIFQNEYVVKGVPFYRTKEIVELSENKPISLELFISEKRFEEIKKKFGAPQKGDLLISAVGTIGISWVVSDDRKFYFKDGNLLWIKNFKGIDPFYLKMVLDSIIKAISKISAGAAYNALTIMKVKKIQIPIPPFETQRKIVEKLSTVQEYKKKLLDQKQKLQELFESVLNKSMRGELVK